LKGGNNLIHDNEFYNMAASTNPPISMYEQYLNVSNNQIYNNNFHDNYYGMIIGNNIDANPSIHTFIHDNHFTSCTYAIWLPFDSASARSYTDIEIYYNIFTNNAHALSGSSDTASHIVDTIIAYNTFTPSISSPSIENFQNTMVYGNTGLTDFNVPSPLPISPR